MEIREDAASEGQRKRIIETIAKLAFLVTLLYTAFYGAMTWWELTGFSASFLVWYAATLAISSRGRTRVAGLVLMLGGFIQISGISIFFLSPMGGTQYFMALLPIFCILTISPKDRGWIALNILAPLLLLVYLEVNRDTFTPLFALELEPALMRLLRGFSITVTVVMIVAVFISYFLDLRRAQQALSDAHERSESLLLNILPESIAERLKAGEETIADNYSEVSILFTDLVGFTSLAATQSAAETVAMLDQLVSAFDERVAAPGLEKIKTIGDAYMLASGVPHERDDHAEAIIEVALEMQALVRAHNEANDQDLALRIGIGSGPVTAGVIGSKSSPTTSGVTA